MSTAAAFVSIGSFPFCVTDISSSVPAGTAYLDNLTLAQVMAFSWNLETMTVTIDSGTSCTRTTGGGTTNLSPGVTFEFSPFSSDVFDEGRFAAGSMACGDAAAYAAFASCAQIRQPVERVCHDGAWQDGIVFSANWRLSSDTRNVASFAAWVGIDPSNSGKYRFYYGFLIQRAAGSAGGTPPEVVMRWSHSNTVPSGYLYLTGGLLSFGGFSVSYYCTYDADSASGGTVSSSSYSNFTY